MRAPLATSYRRRLINAELARLNAEFARLVLDRGLDIGGGRRAWWWPTPAGWWTVDLFPPVTIVADVQALPFGAASVNVIKAMELFEHVPDTALALGECRRVLRLGGTLIASAPFLERIHADPEDYVRYTYSMWVRLLKTAGFTVDRITAQGGYWTHLAELLRFLVVRAPWGVRHLAALTVLPLLDLMTRLDRGAGPDFAAFVGGWFIVARAS